MTKKTKIYLSLIFIIFSIGLCVSYAIADETGIYLERIFYYAKRNDVKSLEEIKDKIKLKDNEILDIAYSLALYIASPEKYQQKFVDDFPVTYEGLMVVLYQEIELKQLTPKFLYSVESIGIIAERGNEKAIRKILEGYIHSDGVVSEFLCDILLNLFRILPQKTLKILSGFDKNQREIVYSCFKSLNKEEVSGLINSLRQINITSEEEKIVIKEIEINNQ